MTTPKGTRAKPICLVSGDAVHVYSNATEIVLQLRRSVATVDDMKGTSFKVGVVLSPPEALALAGELLTVAAYRLTSEAAQKNAS